MFEFEPNISIDISLLAIILGSYASKKNRNLTLLLICLLFAHIILTKEKEEEEDDLSADENENENEEEDDEEEDDKEEEEENQRASSASSAVGAVGAVGAASAASAASTQNAVPVPRAYKSTVSSGVFDRQLSTPQTAIMSTVFPSTSAEANGKLASARGSFFKSLVS